MCKEPAKATHSKWPDRYSNPDSVWACDPGIGVPYRDPSHRYSHPFYMAACSHCVLTASIPSPLCPPAASAISAVTHHASSCSLPPPPPQTSQAPSLLSTEDTPSGLPFSPVAVLFALHSVPVTSLPLAVSCLLPGARFVSEAGLRVAQVGLALVAKAELELRNFFSISKF